MNQNCIDCGWYGKREELKEDEHGTKCRCPECGSRFIYSDEGWENS